MKIPKYNFEGDIEVLNLGDIHLGEDACDRKMFQAHIDYILENENSYWVSTGDMLNVSVRKGRFSSIYHAMPFDQEFKLFLEMVAPIADKCLGFVGSNHHGRIENEVGLSVDEMIEREVGIPYLGDVGILKVTCDRVSYFMAMHHGVGHGRMKGAKINSLERLSQIVPAADIYMQGHTHTYMHFINEFPYIDRKRDKVSHFNSAFVNTGHYLNWEDSYAPKLGLAPAPKGAARLKLKAGGIGGCKDVRVDLFG